LPHTPIVVHAFEFSVCSHCRHAIAVELLIDRTRTNDAVTDNWWCTTAADERNISAAEKVGNATTVLRSAKASDDVIDCRTITFAQIEKHKLKSKRGDDHGQID
jgi:hypothetical protein